MNDQVKKIAEKACADHYSVAPKYRTGEHLQALIESAIREALQGEWVSVEEGLPQSGKEVEFIVNDNGVSIRFLGCRTEEGQWYTDCDDEYPCYGVTHWSKLRPLPVPPETKSTERESEHNGKA